MHHAEMSFFYERHDTHNLSAARIARNLHASAGFDLDRQRAFRARESYSDFVTQEIRNWRAVWRGHIVDPQTVRRILHEPIFPDTIQAKVGDVPLID